MLRARGGARRDAGRIGRDLRGGSGGSSRVRTATKYIFGCANIPHAMADTKRGRVQKSHREDRRRRRREIELALERREEEIDFDELYEDVEVDR